MLSHGGERTFWRLKLVADDFGRFNAEPSVLTATCFPLMIREITDKQIQSWLDELCGAAVTRIYTVGGTRYGYFVNWTKYQQTRALKSKFPEPPSSDSPCDHLQADFPEKKPPRSDSNTNTDTITDSIMNTDLSPSLDDFLKFWYAYPRKDKKKPARVLWKKLTEAEKASVLADLPRRIKANWAGREVRTTPLATTYLNERQWEDELQQSNVIASPTPVRRFSPARGALIESILQDRKEAAESETLATQGSPTQGQRNLDTAADG
jgi:hypothetical protein